MTSVFGRPVNGDITKPSKSNVEQWDGARLLPLLDAVLNHEQVAAVRWYQYTPYFNDGEPCLFGLGEISIKLTPEARTDELDEDDDEEFLETYSLSRYRDGTYASGRVGRLGFEELYPLVEKLEGNFSHFETFLEETFGDHAVVTATPEGFDVEFYEHD